MKKLISLFVTIIYISFVAVSGFATENEYERIYFEDGSYLSITIDTVQSRTTGTKNAGKTYTYTSNNGEVVWKAILSGTFTYTGTSATCTASSCDVTIFDSDWYVISKTVGNSGASAICELSMGQKLLGITVNKKNISMILTCDANGNLS